MNFELMWESLPRLLAGLGVTIQLVVLSLAVGLVGAFGLAAMRLAGGPILSSLSYAYVFVLRGTPLLVQIFLIYYGLGQFEFIRSGLLWPFLRDAYWCAILALAMNTAAYTAEIIRGAVLSIPFGQVEAARACGMPRLLIVRRIIAPLAIRQALPAYGNEIILMVKASSLASTVTILDITGIAKTIISRTYAVIEIFVVAGAIYLLINYLVTRAVRLAEWRLSPHLRPRAH